MFIAAIYLSVSYATLSQSTTPSYFLTVHFNIISSTSRSSKWSPSLRFPHQHLCIYPYYKNQQDALFTFNFIVFIIIFRNGLDRLTRSGIDALPSSLSASTISSSSRFVVEGVFRKSGVFHSFKMVNPVLFVFGSHVLYSRDL